MQSVIAVALLRMDDWWMTSRLKRCYSGGNKEMVDAVARPSCKLPLAAAFTPGAYKLQAPLATAGLVGFVFWQLWRLRKAFGRRPLLGRGLVFNCFFIPPILFFNAAAERD